MLRSCLNKFQYMTEIQKFTRIAKDKPIADIIQFNKEYQKQFVGIQFNYQINGFYQYIQNEIIPGDIEELNQAACHYFSKEGKLVRPSLNLLFYQHLDKSMPNQDSQMTWAAVIEILHVASLIHDDILDDSYSRRGLETAHIIYGKKRATFSANYLIGRAGRKIAELEDLTMFQIYSQIMDNLTNGEYLQALKRKDYEHFDSTMRNYMIKTYYKTAALLANSLKGVCQLTPFKDEGVNAFNIGLHLGILYLITKGMAFQLIDDVLDYTSSSSDLGKANLSDLKNGVVTGPVLFEYFNQYQTQSSEYRLMNSVLHGKSKEIDEVNRIVLNGNGIAQTQYLAYLHTQEALKLLKQINSPQEDLLSLIFLILSRKK